MTIEKIINSNPSPKAVNGYISAVYRVPNITKEIIKVKIELLS